MVANPFQHTLFGSVAITLGVLFALGLLGILAASRGDVRKVIGGSLFRRWQTWAIITPIYVLAVLSGPAATLLLALGLAVQGVREYAHLVRLPPLYERVLIGMTLVVLPTTLVSPELFLGLPPLLLILGTLQPLLTRDVQAGARHLAFAALGFGYLPWLLGFLVLIPTHLAGGDGLLLGLALAVALSDVGAFAAGSVFGRHRLSPTLSPSKTWGRNNRQPCGREYGNAVALVRPTRLDASDCPGRIAGHPRPRGDLGRSCGITPQARVRRKGCWSVAARVRWAAGSHRQLAAGRSTGVLLRGGRPLAHRARMTALTE